MQIKNTHTDTKHLDRNNDAVVHSDSLGRDRWLRRLDLA